jgi:DNA-binding transcriptional ArsR family regulator
MHPEGIELHAWSRLFKTLGEPTRLRIVSLLCQKERSVQQIQEALGLAQPCASGHLAVLRSAGLVQHRKVGKYVIYGLFEQSHLEVFLLLQELLRTIVSSGATSSAHPSSDRARLGPARPSRRKRTDPGSAGVS